MPQILLLILLLPLVDADITVAYLIAYHNA